MIDTVVVQPSTDIGEPGVGGISWAAVVAGAVVSCALTLVVLAFGVGLGLSVVSPWAGSGVSATTFKIGTGLFMIVVAMLSSSIGGYIAGRLRSRWIGVHTDEVYFRDTAHGFVAWALATVVGAVLLASPVNSVIGGAAGADLRPDGWLCRYAFAVGYTRCRQCRQCLRHPRRTHAAVRE
jgi:hypothetical protein